MNQDIEFKTGKMTKDPRSMSDEERREWERRCAENARNYLFSIGQPLVYKQKDGRTVAEYKDGRIQVIR
jgi:predicted AAA+ superfamily ATPase